MSGKNGSGKKRSGGKGIAAARGARSGPSPALIVGIVVVVLFAAAVGFGVYYSNASKNAAAGLTPAAAVAAGGDTTGLLVGSASAPKQIDVYLDFQCPVCKAYEQQVGPMIDQYVSQGKAKAVYHPVAFLNRFSGGSQYSTRSSEAAACVADAAPSAYPQFMKLLYANQPPENGGGLPDSQLISYAEQAGAPDSVAQCVNDQKFAGWTSRVTDTASKNGINGTPTVQVDGKQIDNTPEALQAAIG